MWYLGDLSSCGVTRFECALQMGMGHRSFVDDRCTDGLGTKFCRTEYQVLACRRLRGFGGIRFYIS
jgi:hypothetical protein